jgi:hypothetical protein
MPTGRKWKAKSIIAGKPAGRSLPQGNKAETSPRIYADGHDQRQSRAAFCINLRFSALIRGKGFV